MRYDPPWTPTALLLAGFIAASLPAAPARAQAPLFQGAHHIVPLDQPAIDYQNAQPHDPVAGLIERLDQGQAGLTYDPKFGYLPSLLEHLGVPVSSQMLVYSRTSLQVDHITPRTPRAIYFNDDVYIGYVHSPGKDAMIEIASADPVHGAIFYVLDQQPRRDPRPRPRREDSCLQCHASGQSMGVPGHLARSHLIDARGDAISHTGTSSVDDRTPIAQRWGGWYLTGDVNGQTHLGNRPWPMGKPPEGDVDTSSLSSLAPFVDESLYLSGHSDAVALLVYEHQRQMHNFMTRLSYDGRVHLNRYGHIDYLDEPIEAFLRYLFFVEEAPWDAPISGTTTFREEFEALGPTDSRGRSLRDLNLQTRLAQYPCSFMIHTEAFDALPAPVLERIYRRMWAILSGEDRDPPWDRISKRQREAVLEILVDTKPGLPACWRASR